MLNELEEFKAYTTPVKYEVNRKGDTALLGRFTFESLLSFENLYHPGKRLPPGS